MKKISLSEIRRTVREVIRENENPQYRKGTSKIKRLEDGLTVDMLKSRYPWVLEANIENAVIGLNGNNICWYGGTWHDGVWRDGIWKMGTFAGGTWEDGRFYFGTFAGERWKNGRFHGGKFAGGIWESGEFHGGTFAGETWESGEWYHTKVNLAIWESGEWVKGRILYVSKEGRQAREIFVNPNEYFKG